MVLLWVMIAGMACATAQAPNAQKSASTEEERRKAVMLTRFLESNPYHENAKATRQWLLLWAIEVPDITVSMCADLIPELLEQKEQKSDELSFILIQLSFGALAAIIQDPAVQEDRKAQDLAGVESALKVYESIQAKDPSKHWGFLDDLLSMRKNGTLKAEIARRTDKCIEPAGMVIK
jgi:hypothetical protein